MDKLIKDSNAPKGGARQDAMQSSPAGVSPADIPILNDPVDKKPASKGNGGIAFLVVLALLVAIVAGGGTYFIWLQQMKAQEHLQQVLQQTEDKFDRSGRGLDQLKTELHQTALEQDKQQQRLQQEIDQLHKQLTSQQLRLQALSSTDRTDWLLAEVEYLLRLANQRILMGGEVSGAEALLTAADQIIRELDDMALYPVRKSIASDLASVRAVTELDIQGVYVQLLALAEQVDQLPLFNAPENEQKKTENKEELIQVDDNASRFEQIRFQLTVSLKKLAEKLGIRYRDYDVEPLLPPEEHFYLRQNIQLKFEQAKSALMSGKQTVYQQSLMDAQGWLAKYYQLAGHPAQVAMESLTELQKVEVTQSLPDVSGSLRTLKVYLEMRYGTGAVKQVDEKANTATNSAEGE